MEYLVVPMLKSESSVQVWVGRWMDRGYPASYVLIAKNGTGFNQRRSWSSTAWDPIGMAGYGIPACRFRTFSFDLLPSTSTFVCYLEDGDGKTLAWATFETLPSNLRARTDSGSTQPSQQLRILLGSCFSWEDDDGAVGRTYQSLYDRLDKRPHLKLLVGDQVYVDQPPTWWILPKDTSSIRRRVNRAYYESWKRLRRMLPYGANVFSTDDHEYWNDYPFKPLRAWPALQDSSVRRRAAGITTTFAQYLQGVANSTRQYTIGKELSILVAETRRWRSESRFITAEGLDRINMWISRPRIPGHSRPGSTTAVGTLRRRPGDQS